MAQARRLIEKLVRDVSPNARVIAIDERDRDYRVTIAGTTGVTATCDLARDDVAAAERRDDARGRLAAVLKSAAELTVAAVPDARA